ncbi:hypothetical protein [Rhodococcus spongiicola]|uniref:Uncharacterized protein n=1 Tax=Rhodococcus spongiicola TaxID=2487352 RepID=A0A3S3A766_9NOCA|nr:hypothetical protein [Rhodococcus spongiicola]RVW03621.1 hypothetical protein EF834_11050 [Rhodococcus spongiicola]
MTEWVQMLVGMADGPTQPVHGVVLPYRNSDKPFHFYYATYGEEPIFLPMRRDGVRLYRWGRRSRIESIDGEVWFVSDGTTAWDFTADPARPRCTEVRNVRSPGPGRHLAITPPVTHWVGRHHARPTGPVTDLEFLGRRCWSVDLAPRESRNLPKPSLRLIVDAHSGAVLGQHSGDGIDGAAYTDVTVGEPLDPSLFTWDGPVVTDGESRAGAGRGDTPDMEATQWFRENVTAEPIHVPVMTDFTPRFIDSIDRQSGAFSATLGPDRSTGWLIRRPRSTEPWTVKTYGRQIAWSTESFDWACQVHGDGTLDAAGISALQQQLHPDEPVMGTPQLVFGGSDEP